MKIRITFFIVSFFVVAQIYAQQPPKIKFEKVSEEELKMTVYDSDTTAVAVILFDSGSSEIKYDKQKDRFMLNYERFVRIKILKQTGTDWGNFSIPLYSSPQNKEEIAAVEGTTFNIENGKMAKTEMKKESVFKERENKYWEMVRLSLPSVKIGSVIDLKYSIYSPLLWNLQEWEFQYLIPVKWSQYEVIHPEYFDYNQSSMGYHRMNAPKHTTRNETINFTSSTITPGSALSGGGQRQLESHSISYLAKIYNFSAYDVPAMKEEPYLSTLDNYTTKVKFELAVMDFTKIGGAYKSYTNSWKEIANDLLNDEDFGGQIKSANYAKDEIASLINGKADEKQKMIAIYNYVQHNIKWNGSRSYMPAKPLRRIFTEKNGNSAEINLLLIAMLNEAGIEANPVILSTRDNGMLPVAHATLSDCNYVIASAVINEIPVLLDATEVNLSAGLLPFRCLNGTGRMIKRDIVDDVALTNVKSTSNTLVFMELKEGKFSGNVVSSETGLNAFNFRESVKKAGGRKEYFDKLRNSSTDVLFNDYKYTNVDSAYQQLEKRYTIELQNQSESDADIIYIDPVLLVRTTKNPFTSPTREYPVDFGVASDEIYQLNLIVPDGYTVEELPQSKSYTLEGKSAMFMYRIQKIDNRIILSTRLNIGKTLFLPAEYPQLKDFFDIVVAKESEQIVLKKITN